MNEEPKKVKIVTDIPKACERYRAKLNEAALITATALQKDEEAIAEGKPGAWNSLSAGVAYLRHLMRPKPDTLAWEEEIGYYLARDPRLRYVSETPNVYKTPAEVLDFVTANPPMGEPQPPPPEKERHMGYREAVDIFMRLAKSRQRTAEEVTALEMAARQMCRRHFQRQRNWARRREAANAEGGVE